MNRAIAGGVLLIAASAQAMAALRAGVGKAEITDREAGPVNDPCYARALVLQDGATTAVLVSVDAVAIGEIGRIPNGYMASVRSRLKAEAGIAPESLIVNASHCHCVVRRDTDALTVEAVKQALRGMTPVRAGAGRGREDRVMENRRVLLKDGTQADMRRAYTMPPDEEVAAIGPVDPEIGLLRLDKPDGTPFAALYNFAMHPIMGVPGGGNTADITGFASQAIEENLGGGPMAFFVQGAGGDINPAKYKNPFQPHDAEPLGNRLAASALRGLRTIRTRETGPMRLIHEKLTLPRGADLDRRIAAAKAEREKLVDSIAGTSIDLKTFLALFVQHRISAEFPSHYGHRYAHEKAAGLDGLAQMDADNRAEMERYVRNVRAMEKIARLKENISLLEKHRARIVAEGTSTLDVEVVGLRVGDFAMVTFPGELTVEVGLNVKKRAPGPFSFVAGYTNGYIYYTATAAQRNNTGFAQEDCDAMVGPGWQRLFEDKAQSVFERLLK